MKDYYIYRDGEDEYIIHTGTPHEGDTPHSGRYKWGMGKHPFQHESWFPGFGEPNQTFWGFVENSRKEGLTDYEIAKACGTTLDKLRYDIYIELRNQGITDTQTLAEQTGWKAAMVKRQDSLYKAEMKDFQISQARKLAETGQTAAQIGETLGVPTRTVNDWINGGSSGKSELRKQVVDLIKNNVEEKGVIQVGAGVDAELGIKENMLNDAVLTLMNQGYQMKNIKVPQVGTQYETTVRVLMRPDIQTKDVYANMDMIQTITDYTTDEGKQIGNLGLRPVESLSSDRLQIVYNEEGGKDKDGIIEVRRGAEDLDLGEGTHYAQVRIAVDDKLYLKGVAVYSDDLPEGVDVRFNTSKPIGKPLDETLKAMKKIEDPETGEKVINRDNPFGASIKASFVDPDTGLLVGGQHEYISSTGEKKLSLINKVNEEGDWDTWSHSLAGQFLSKQDIPLIEKQIRASIEEKEQELEAIRNVANPVLRKLYLEEFGDNLDVTARELRTVSLPGQSSKLLLPCPSLKPNEVYAPTYPNGTKLWLVRYPHAGVFEIPTVIVNNNNPEGKRIYGGLMPDAIGINPKTAQQLSGADYDGDTAIVIPETPGVHVHSEPYLEELIGFDPDLEFPPTPTSKRMKKENVQQEMGSITNLITDMTVSEGASREEIARAVKHSMVIIDAFKHEYDYKKAEEVLGIKELKLKYQGKNSKGQAGGAGTIFSRASSEDRVPERDKYSHIDPETGERVWDSTGRTKRVKSTHKEKTTYVDENGKVRTRIISVDDLDENGKPIYVDSGELVTTKVTKMDTHKDARELMSGPNNEGTPKEVLFADYANRLKAMANAARKESLGVQTTGFSSKTVAEKYSDEIASLTRKLSESKKNAPREKQAQAWANARIKEQTNSTKELDQEDLKKIRNQALSAARVRFGASKYKIEFDEKELEALNAGALNATFVRELYANSDKEKLKTQTIRYSEKVSNASKLSESQLSRIRNLANKSNGPTLAEIAEQFGVSTSTISQIISA